MNKAIDVIVAKFNTQLINYFKDCRNLKRNYLEFKKKFMEEYNIDDYDKINYEFIEHINNDIKFSSCLNRLWFFTDLILFLKLVKQKSRVIGVKGEFNKRKLSERLKRLLDIIKSFNDDKKTSKGRARKIKNNFIILVKKIGNMAIRNPKKASTILNKLENKLPTSILPVTPPVEPSKSDKPDKSVTQIPTSPTTPSRLDKRPIDPSAPTTMKTQTRYEDKKREKRKKKKKKSKKRKSLFKLPSFSWGDKKRKYGQSGVDTRYGKSGRDRGTGTDRKPVATTRTPVDYTGPSVDPIRTLVEQKLDTKTGNNTKWFAYGITIEHTANYKILLMKELFNKERKIPRILMPPPPPISFYYSFKKRIRIVLKADTLQADTSQATKDIKNSEDCNFVTVEISRNNNRESWGFGIKNNIITKIKDNLNDKLMVNDIVTGHNISNYNNKISLRANLKNTDLLKINLTLQRCIK